MTQLYVTGAPIESIIIGAKGIEEIRQNVQIILTTLKGTVFLDRQFGIDISNIDKPQNLLLSAIRTDIIQQIEEYEPRVNILSVDYVDIQDNGTVVPKVTFTIKNEALA